MSTEKSIGTIGGFFCVVVLITALSLAAAERPQQSKLPELQPRVAAVKPSQVTVSPNANIAYVVVKFVDPAKVRLRGDRLVSFNNRSLKAVNDILSPVGASGVRRLMTEIDEAKLDRDREVLQVRSGRQLADMNSYYRIEVSSPGQAEALVNRLNELDEVEIAYVQPMPEPAGDIAPTTPDYVAGQLYRQAAPAGVDADWANTQPGGDGSGVKIIDIEGAWQETHEDLDPALNGLIGGYEIPDLDWRNHGTAVVGVMVAPDNGYGVTGICHGAEVGMVAIGIRATSEAILLAAENLEPGDLMLIELHAPGPHYNYENRADQLGYVCMEFWQDNFDALQYAWAQGITVCQAAGNGAENFDDAGLYGQLFDTTYRNSHAIMCGAGYGANSAFNLQRQGFSNFGERVNLQGYGSSVYTTGYGGLFNGGGDENQYYTAGFSGTSSASPIVTGSVACLQGWYKANYGVAMSTDQLRTILVATGTPQTGNQAEHIGPRPNLQAAITSATAPPSLYTSPLFLDSASLEGSVLTESVWLYNRSNVTAIDFSIDANDNWESSGHPDWLTASPSVGAIGIADSIEITVSLDGTVLAGSPNVYKGLLDVSWSASGQSLDSTSLVPVYYEVQCNDQTWSAESSSDPGGPAFNWISAKDLGNRIPNTSFKNVTGTDPLDDGTTVGLLMGFNFPFFDSTTYNKVYIGANGALSFTDTLLNFGGFFGNVDFPGNPFSSLISAFWSDLIIDQARAADAGVYMYKTPGLDSVIIEWHNVSSFNAASDTSITFEIILSKYGEIVLQYLRVGTTGLENTAAIGASEVDCQSFRYFDAGDPVEHTVANNTRIELTNTTRVIVLGGDWDFDGSVSPVDLSSIVDYLFNGEAGPSPESAGDFNCDGICDPVDLSYFVDYLFSGGDEPCVFLQYN